MRRALPALVCAVVGCVVVAAAVIVSVNGQSTPSSGSECAVGDRPTRVVRCGLILGRNGFAWSMAAGTVYRGLDDPDASIARVQELGLNTVRITNFLGEDGPVSADSAFDERAWRRVDRLIATAAARDVAVLLDLSTYRNLLLASGVNPYTVDWSPFLQFVVDRRNSVTDVRYGDDPTIALVAFAGEPDAVAGPDNTYGLTEPDLTRFYREVQSFWRARAPAQLLTTGGLLYLDWDSGIGWRAILALPHNDVATVHVYSDGDRRISVPDVAEFSASLGRPWVLEEFGFQASIGDSGRSERVAEMFTTARRYDAAGIGIWNVGDERADTYDVGPQFPMTFAAVVAGTDSLLS